MLTPDRLAFESEAKVKEIIAYASKVIFGVDPGNLDNMFLPTCFNAVCERFSTATILDIQTAYRTFLNKSKSAYTVTRDEVLQPIQDYWNKKQVVLNSINTELERLNHEEDLKYNFRKNAEKKYLDSLEAGEWIGDCFEANVLARDYAPFIKQKIKEKMWKSAWEDYVNRTKQARVALELDPYASVLPVPSAERLYSQRIMEFAVTNNINLIVE